MSTFFKFVELLSELEWRSKLLKDVQYAVKLFVAVAPLLARRPSPGSIDRLSSMAKHLSLARRLFEVGSFLEDVPDITGALREEGSLGRVRVALGVINFATDCMDDCVTLSKVKAIPPQWISARFERVADVLWAAGTLIALALAVVKALEIRRRMRDEAAAAAAAAAAASTKSDAADAARIGDGSPACEDVEAAAGGSSGAVTSSSSSSSSRARRAAAALHVTHVSIAKYVFDMVQCVPDACDIDVPESLYALGGLLSGLASTYKIWVTHK